MLNVLTPKKKGEGGKEKVRDLQSPGAGSCLSGANSGEDVAAETMACSREEGRETHVSAHLLHSSFPKVLWVAKLLQKPFGEGAGKMCFRDLSSATQMTTGERAGNGSEHKQVQLAQRQCSKIRATIFRKTGIHFLFCCHSEQS